MILCFMIWYFNECSEVGDILCPAVYIISIFYNNESNDTMKTKLASLLSCLANNLIALFNLTALSIDFRHDRQLFSK